MAYNMYAGRKIKIMKQISTFSYDIRCVRILMFFGFIIEGLFSLFNEQISKNHYLVFFGKKSDTVFNASVLKNDSISKSEKKINFYANFFTRIPCGHQ